MVEQTKDAILMTWSLEQVRLLFGVDTLEAALQRFEGSLPFIPVVCDQHPATCGTIGDVRQPEIGTWFAGTKEEEKRLDAVLVLSYFDPDSLRRLRLKPVYHNDVIIQFACLSH